MNRSPGAAVAQPFAHAETPPIGAVAGLAAMTALLAAAWLGHALAHTVILPADRLPAAHRSIDARQAGLRAAQDAAAAKLVAQQAAAQPAPPPQTFRQMSPQQAAAANAAIPFSVLPNPAAAPFKLDAADTLDRGHALDCLTMAVYYEAASEPDQGQAAVAQVVLNRLRNPLFPKTVCGVVLQGSDLPTGCQFTFTCDGSLGRLPSQTGWTRARHTAERALNGYVEKSVGEATHYHTVWVVPYWQPTLVKLTQIGAHIFYRWAGELGRPVAFHGLYAGAEPTPPMLAGFTQPDKPPVMVVTKAVIAAAASDATPKAPVVAVKAAAPIKLASMAALAAPAAEVPQIQPLTANESYFGRRDDNQIRPQTGF